MTTLGTGPRDPFKVKLLHIPKHHVDPTVERTTSIPVYEEQEFKNDFAGLARNLQEFKTDEDFVAFAQWLFDLNADCAALVERFIPEEKQQ